MSTARITPADVPDPADAPIPLVLVTLGTAPFPMERLVGWVERWIVDNPGRARVVVQYGTTRLPKGAEGFEMCPHDEVVEWHTKSHVVVTQGGPGGIMDSRNCGILPIAVPRRGDLGEMVDDHQVRFSRHAVRNGLIRLATTEEEFRTELEAALADPESLRVDVSRADIDAAVERTGMLIEDLVRRKPGRLARRRRRKR